MHQINDGRKSIMGIMIESNLEGTRDYIAKAADALERAQVEHKKGNSKMCCIAVAIICITLVAMYPILSMF